MADTAKLTFKCRMCDGLIVYNYLSGSCICDHCGNKWPIEEFIPDYSKYSRVIGKITRANDILEGDPTISETEQARLLYQIAADECDDYSGEIASELVQLCNEGRDRAEKLKEYIRGKTLFDNRTYEGALEIFSNMPGYKNADELAAKCREQMELEKKKKLPLSIITGLILPAVLCIFLKEKAGFPLAANIPIYLACSAGLAYLVHKGGIPSVIISIMSFLCAVPLILFLILAYAFHVDIIPSFIISVGLPIAVMTVFAIIGEKNN